jgi:hypothetical protein
MSPLGAARLAWRLGHAARWELWNRGHVYLPMIGDYCRVCSRETRSHDRLCPIWLLRP